MVFKKWILKYGLGSPGHTARAITKRFHYYLASNAIFNGNTENDAYLTIYSERSYIQEKLRNRGCILSPLKEMANNIIYIGDMPLFVFTIQTLESKQFRAGISEDNVDLVLTVIREEVAKMDDSLIRLDKYEYRNMSIDFLNEVLLFLKQSH